MKPNILFVHAVCPAQFSDWYKYLNTTGTANAYYMTSPGNIARNKHRYRNLIPLMPVGNMMAPKGRRFAKNRMNFFFPSNPKTVR